MKPVRPGTPKSADRDGGHGNAGPERIVHESETLSLHLRFLAEHLGARAVGSEEAARAREYLDKEAIWTTIILVAMMLVLVMLGVGTW